jgi:hypothetical protein
MPHEHSNRRDKDQLTRETMAIHIYTYTALLDRYFLVVLHEVKSLSPYVATKSWVVGKAFISLELLG